MKPEHHHPDCDYRNSHAAKETAEIFALDGEDGPARMVVHDCNLGCDPDYTDATVAAAACFVAEPDDVDSLIDAARAIRDFTHHHTPAIYRPDGYEDALNAIIVRLQGDT